MNPIQNIIINETNMTKSELKIMNYILDNKEEIAQKSLIELAQASDTSKSAILRFCKKIGYEGYSEFKYDISNYLLSPNNSIHESQSQNVVDICASTITEMNHTLDLEPMLYLKEKMLTSNQIKIFGISETGLSANFFAYRLIDYGYDVEAVTQTNLLAKKAKLSTPKDLHIVLSLSANTELITEVIKESYKRKIPTVLITQNSRYKERTKLDSLILLPVFDYNIQQGIILDSQILFHVFFNVFINLLLEK